MALVLLSLLLLMLWLSGVLDLIIFSLLFLAAIITWSIVALKLPQFLILAGSIFVPRRSR